MTVSDATIRGILTTKGTTKELAKKFRVSAQTIWIYKRLKVRKVKFMAARMSGEGIPLDLWDVKHKTKKFSPGQVQNIRESTDTSATQAEHYDCSPSMIRMIRTGKSYV